MIKTWLIPITTLILITVILLMINMMIFINSVMLANYLEQKSEALLADSFIIDVFEGFDAILNRSICKSEGNFTILKQVLEKETGEFMNRVYETSDFFNEYGVLINFTYAINYAENYSIEIDVKVYVKELEGRFSFERSHNVIKMLG